MYYDNMCTDQVPLLDQCDALAPWTSAVMNPSLRAFCVDASLMHVYSCGLTLIITDRWAMHFAHKWNDSDSCRVQSLHTSHVLQEANLGLLFQC